MSRRQKTRWGGALSLAALVALTLSLAMVPARRAGAEDDLPDLSGDPALDSLESAFGGDGNAEKSAPPAAQAEPPPSLEEKSPPKLSNGEPSDAEVDELANSLAAEVSPAPAVSATAPARSASASPAAPEPSTPNEITNLEFKTDAKGSQIVVRSQRKLRFNESKSVGAKQLIYILENTVTPEKYQRAYDTTEFPSAVALFTLFQIPNAPTPTSKLIVQLREDQIPSLTDSDRGLILEFPPFKTGDPKLVDTAKRDILSGDNIYARGGSYSGDVIQRLEIKNSDVQDVLRLIARTSGYNIVIGEEVTGKIGTLSLTNIPWDQAFTLILQSKRLGFLREGNVLRVGTTASLKTEKEEAAAVEKAAEAVEPLKTLLLPISYGKVADLVPRGKSFLTPRGTIEADIRTNTIIIKDIEKVVTRVQRLLQSLDMQPPRVSVSAKIVEMNSSITRTIGLGALTGQGSLGGTNALGLGFRSSTATGSFAATLTAPTFLNLESNFRLGELDKKVRTLANPSVTVVANQTGTVTQSMSFFIPNTTIVAGALQPGYTQVNTSLNMSVTPIVSGDGSIFMTVSLNNDIPTVTGGNSTIASRAVTTQVLVENGDTAVIGGVFQNTVENNRDGIPWLMRIPILGYLFSGQDTTDRSSEIFVFLTAKILNAEEAFKRSF